MAKCTVRIHHAIIVMSCPTPLAYSTYIYIIHNYSKELVISCFSVFDNATNGLILLQVFTVVGCYIVALIYVLWYVAIIIVM